MTKRRLKRLIERLRPLALPFALLLAPAGAAAQEACAPVDFTTVPVAKSGNPIAAALELAYPGVQVDVAANRVTVPGSDPMLFHDGVERGNAEALETGSVRDQFRHLYPLTFDLTARETPWADPGRIRHQPLFLALYGRGSRQVRAVLRRVRGPSGHAPSFQMTTLWRVHCQTTAAMQALSDAGLLDHPAFEDVGGSFNWRRIAGTDRLSAHSYGAALDLNPKLGGYWRWAGRPEGDAGPYRNRIPREIVEIFERHGFIWGGKWHHFDGMHFEYRPELILYARLVAE